MNTQIVLNIIHMLSEMMKQKTQEKNKLQLSSYQGYTLSWVFLFLHKFQIKIVLLNMIGGGGRKILSPEYTIKTSYTTFCEGMSSMYIYGAA